MPSRFEGPTQFSVDKSIVEHVRGNAHAHNIERFWADLKRTIDGMYIHIHQRHRDRYLRSKPTDSMSV
jgi:hypothetical protein